MNLSLPWPPRELSPNARIHYLAKARAVKAYREQAYWLTAASRDAERADHAANFLIIKRPKDSPITLAFTFHPPDKRKRDLDSMFSSCKAAIDGIADALGVNDVLFEFNLKRADPVKGGCVKVQIT